MCVCIYLCVSVSVCTFCLWCLRLWFWKLGESALVIGCLTRELQGSHGGAKTINLSSTRSWRVWSSRAADRSTCFYSCTVQEQKQVDLSAALDDHTLQHVVEQAVHRFRLCLCHCLPLFVGQFISPHHSNQKSQGSQRLRVAIWVCFVIGLVCVFVFFIGQCSCHVFPSLWPNVSSFTRVAL